MDKSNFSFGIIGRFEFSTKCANALLGEGIDLQFVIALDEQLYQWSLSHQLSVFSSLEEFKKAKLPEVDYILCVGLLGSLPPWILSRSTYGLICYHENLLEGEITQFDPALAILSRKKTHGLSWSQLSQQVDQCDILFQSSFPLSPKDSASDIVRRCETDAITGLYQVLAALKSSDNISPIRQSVNISYHKNSIRLPNAGVLNWESKAIELERLIHALDFDRYINTLGTAKLIGNQGTYIVNKATALASRSQLIPGIVVKISSKSIQVGCKEGRLELKSFKDQYGNPIDIRTFVQNENLEVGDQLPLFSVEELNDFEEQHKIYARVENNWVDRLKSINNIDLPLVLVADNNQEDTDLEVEIPRKLISRLEKIVGEKVNISDLLFSLIVIYFNRLLNQGQFTLPILKNEHDPKDSFAQLVSSIQPFNCELTGQSTFIDFYQHVMTQRQQLNNDIGFISDIYLRYPSLLHEMNPFDTSSVVVSFGDDTVHFKKNLGNRVGFLISEIKNKIYIIDELTAKKNPHQTNLVLQEAPKHIGALASSIVEFPDLIIDKLPLLSQTDLESVLGLYAKHEAIPSKFTSISEAFVSIVERYPNHIALKFHDKELTYAELNNKANQVANYLVASGVRKNHIVAIYVERSIEMVIGMIGIIKSGAAYLPLHPEHPISYLDYILRDAKPDLLLTTMDFYSNALNSLDQKTPIIILEDCLSYGETVNPTVKINSDDILYVIYTSGSTGNPKGSVITQSNVLSFIAANNRAFKFNQEDIWLLFHSYSFDFSICELWGGLLLGGKVVICDSITTRDPAELSRLLIEEKISLLFLITTAFVNLSNFVVNNNIVGFSLRYFMVGGEKLRVNAITQWQDKFGKQSPQFVNLYGPTECTVLSTYRMMPPRLTDLECEANDIGIPFEDTRVFVLDSQSQLLPFGFPGELCLGGGGVAKGYLNRDGLTQERFITFNQDKSDSAKIYRSGDLVSMSSDGHIHYIKRIDRQVKIRGFRVELDEISIQMRTIPFVKFAETIDYTDRFGNQRLAAFIIPKKDYINEDVGINKEFQKKYSTLLRDSLAKLIPPFMLPGNFIFLEKFPYTHNGKIDFTSLAEIAIDLGRNYKIYGQSDQEVLEQIWKKYLQKDSIRMHDNFLALGGDSIISIQIAAEAAQFGIFINPHWLFEYPTISQLIEVIHKNKGRNGNQAILHNRALYQPVREILELPTLPSVDKISTDRYPLVPLQQGMLYHSIEKPNQAIYVQQMIIKLRGNLDTDCFIKAWSLIIRRHALLRTGFVYEGVSDLFQIVYENVELDYKFIDWTDLSSDEYQSMLEKFTYEDRKKGFDLTKPPLFRITLIKSDDESLHFVLTIHHIICDGWSVSLMFNEVYKAYDSFIYGREPELGLAIPFGVYYIWLNQQDSTEAKNYWKSLLANVDTVSQMNIDSHCSEEDEYDSYEIIFDKSISRRLDPFCKEHHLTLNSIVQSAWAILLSKYSYSNQVLFGITSSGRANDFQNIESIFGVLIHTLPVYLEINPDQSLKEFLETVQKQQQTSRQHCHYSLSDIHRLTEIPANIPLFSYLFVFENYPATAKINASTGNILIEDMSEVYSTHYPLTFVVFPGELLKFKINFLRSRFARKSIENMMVTYQNILNGILSNYEGKLNQISMFSKHEYQNILKYYNTKLSHYLPKFTIDQLFEIKAEDNPHAIAAIFEGRCITYSELNHRANQFARYLDQQGVLPGDCIGVILPRDFSLLITILAVLKVGGVFVPCDPSYPYKRNQYILDSCQPKLIISSKLLIKEFNINSKQLIRFDKAQSAYINFPENDLGIKHDMQQKAYILYTSGSTGKPKGVCLKHINAANFIEVFLNTFSSEELRGVLFSSSIAFDLSILEIFGALCSGGRLHMVNNVSDLTSTPYANNITFINAVPSSVKLLLDIEGVPPSVQTLILTGESFTHSLIEDIYSKTSIENIFNGYGPTECGYVSFYRFNKANIEINNVGNAIDHAEFYVLDQSRSLCPVNVPGELFIGGSCVAEGYLNDDNLTAQSFFPNFITNDPGSRLYRTGDLVSWNDDLSLMLHGRIDHQVKVHGYRVEPQEIENILVHHPAVDQAVVVVKEVSPGEKTIIVYFKPTSLVNAPNYQDLIDYLQEYLPGYMIPISFILIDNMPLTPNGKIDKKSLLDMGSMYKQIKRPYVSPDTPTQMKLHEIWAKKLKIERTHISIHDNFFDLGGHSLLVIHMMSLIHSVFAVKIGIHDIINAPTIAQLAEVVEAKIHKKKERFSKRKTEAESSIVALQSLGDSTPLFLVHPGGGTIFCYMSLSRQLGEQRPIYAIQDTGIGDFSNLEQLATYYIKLIKSIQPKGPYLLGGYSMGGVIAWEMAYQLEASGDTVDYLALLDSWAKLTDKMNKRENFDKIMKGPLNGIIAGLSLSNNEELTSWLNLSWERLKLVMKYQPNALKGCHVALFKASVMTPINANVEEDYNHWRKYTTQHIELHSVSGSHSTMLTGENAISLATCLKTSIARISADSPTRSVKKVHDKAKA